MPLERIGKYPVERKLGSGGMGSLFLARHPDLGRLVAIKTLKADYEGDLELRERFLREARSAAQLAHPNIVKVHDFVADGEQPFIVMEYVDGDTLARRLRAEPPLTLDEKLSLLEQLCSGLAHAHAAGIVHRDIKPANLMVDRQKVLRILDFGIARLGNSGMTQEGQIMGSVNYMSPEQVVGRGVDVRTDIFAAGTVMYEVLCQEQAFPGGIDSGVLHRILNEGPTPLVQRVPDIDPALVAIVERAMQRDIHVRYQQAAEMQRDLARARRRLQSVEPGATRVRPSDDSTRVDVVRIAELKRRQLAEYVQAGTEAFSRRQFDTALQFAERAIAVDAGHQPALDLYDRAQFELLSHQVRERLDEAVAHLSEDRLDEAEAALAQASVTLPGVTEASVLTDQVRAVASQVTAARDRQRRITLALERARSSIAQGGYDTALRAVYEVLALDPDRVEARVLERQAQTKLQARREAERAERAALSELGHARKLIEQGRLDAAAAVVAAIDPTSDTIRTRVAEVASDLERARYAEHVATVIGAARQLLEQQRYEDVLAALAELQPEDLREEAQAVRVAAETGIERRRLLERQRQAVEEGLNAVQGLVESGDLERALERIDSVAGVGLRDPRIDEMRDRVAQQLAQERERQLQEARDRQAERRVNAARQLVGQGQEQEAIDLLLRDDGHPAVRQALEELRAEVARRQRLREEAAARERQEAERKRQEAEAVRLREEAAERERQEAEQRRQAEAERKRQEAEAARLREEAAARERQETDQRRQAEAERKRQEAEAARLREEAAARERQEAEERRQAEAERKRQEAEAARLRAEAAARERQEAERKRQEAEAIRLREEAAARERQEAERKRQEAEAIRLREETAERERQEAERKRQEAEAIRLREEAAARERQEAERKRQEAEAIRLREETAERERQEAEERRQAEAERKRQEAEVARLREKAAERERQEAEKRRLAETERIRKEVEAARLREEAAERKRQEAEERRRAKAERERQEAEEEARRPDVTTVVPRNEGATTIVRPPVDRPTQTADTSSPRRVVADRRVVIAAGLIGIAALGALGWVFRPASPTPDAEVATLPVPTTINPRAEPTPAPTPGVQPVDTPPPNPTPAPPPAGTSRPPIAGAGSPPPSNRPVRPETPTTSEAPRPAQVGQVPAPAEDAPPPVAQVPVPPPVVTAPEPPAAPPTAAPAPGAPAPVRVNVEAERAAIARVFDRYVEAYQSMDEGRIRAVDPTFGRFDPRTRTLLRAVRVTLSPLVTSLADDGLSATVSATQSVVNTWDRAGLPTNPPPVAKRWNLRKTGNDWRIVP